MTLQLVLIIGFIISLLILWLSWLKSIGFVKSTIAIVCRFLWLSPIFLSLYPKTVQKAHIDSLSFDTISVFIDDSWSMKQASSKYDKYVPLSSRINEAHNIVNFVKKKCENLGCRVNVTYLSEISPITNNGYSELRYAFQRWLSNLSDKDIWILISDGGDTDLARFSDETYQFIKVSNQGLIIGFESLSDSNKWIQIVKIPPIAFENKSFIVDVTLGRDSTVKKQELLQLQVFVDDKYVDTREVVFYQDEDIKDIQVVMPGLNKGSRLIKLKLLPTADEQVFWDNSFESHVEVMSDTVGVLHLLGAPSWDGRFLRRFLKLEPKYALISFFILREPWDMPYATERELSLIPFPVDRLFKEELANFKLIIMQNFSLFEFLETQYQKNLVNFIKNGGSLLFIGGPKSFHYYDVVDSEFAQILPFKINKNNIYDQQVPNFHDSLFGAFQNRVLIPYNNAKFVLKFASISDEKKKMSLVYDELLSIKSQLLSIKSLQGLNKIENIDLNTDEHIPILNAVLDSGEEIPVVVASYPHKGRAIWILTDSLWRMAISEHTRISKDIYSKFLYTIIHWLLKEEIRKPLVLKNFKLYKSINNVLKWQVDLYGPSLKYFDLATWDLKICDIKLNTKNIQIVDSISDEFIKLKGELDFIQKIDKNICELNIQVHHPLFGFLHSNILANLHYPYSDKDITYSLATLKEISNLIGVDLIIFNKKTIYELVHRWLLKLPAMSVYRNIKVLSENNFYWILEQWWFYILLCFLPLEVMVRRWDKIFII